MAKKTRKPKNPTPDPPVRKQDELPFGQAVIPPQLRQTKKREQWGLPTENDKPGDFMVELNLMHREGLPGAETAFRNLYRQVIPDEERQPQRVDKLSFSCFCTFNEVRELAVEDERLAKIAAEAERAAKVAADAEQAAKTPVEDERLTKRSPSEANFRPHLAIYRIWPDFLVQSHIDKSVATVKADAAFKSYDASGSGIVWAVLDSGIDQAHLHFVCDPEDTAKHTLLSSEVADLHRAFVRIDVMKGGLLVPTALPDADTRPEGMDTKEWNVVRKDRVKQHRDAALSDEYGHGTHVAAILAGSLPEGADPRVLARQFSTSEDDEKVKTVTSRSVAKGRLRGVAPATKLISLRVLDRKGEGRASGIIRALEYIREKLNDDPKLLRVHGVNLSVGYEFDAEMFACGKSPLCSAVDRLVQSGVVVVCAAGNTGYGTLAADQRTTRTGLTTTINDPGNAAHAITVGATHRDSPHTYGVSYFSSKGPTGDGRLKPDIVAPGERVTSAAAGKKLLELLASLGQLPVPGLAYYVDDSGTSMAAPHVSGAIAAFLSIRREFIGRPLDVKKIFLDSATPLGREKYFEGHGLVDLMRAIQSI